MNTGLHVSLKNSVVERICLKIKAFSLDGFILLILITFYIDYAMTLVGET